MARKTSLRTWSIRIGAALIAGLIVGAIIGIIGVNTLDPGRSAAKGTLESTIDSIATGKARSSRPERNNPAEPPSVPVFEEAAPPVAVDSTVNEGSVVPSIDNVVIPDLVGLEEGAARVQLMGMGLRIGTSSFRPSRRPTGTVIATVPPALAYTNPGDTVRLVLSNGRPPRDSISVSVATTAPASSRVQGQGQTR